MGLHGAWRAGTSWEVVMRIVVVGATGGSSRAVDTAGVHKLVVRSMAISRRQVAAFLDEATETRAYDRHVVALSQGEETS